jgi:hypothetical protein
MTGVSTLNLVVQQGGSAQELLHPRQHSVEHAQMVAAQQEAVREAGVKGKVPESPASETLVDKDKRREGNDRRRHMNERQNPKETAAKLPRQPGNLLDTVA